MTDEAPTPDEVDTMMSDIGSLVRVPFQVSRGLQTAKKLRAHIAALKVKYHNAVMDLCEVKEVSEPLNDKVTALEAENKRLREALERAELFIDQVRQDLHHERIADWYPEGAHSSAAAMSESMRVIGNRCADFEAEAALKETP